MQVVLDEPILPNDSSNVRYAGFYPRLGASILDSIILLPVVFAVTYININSWIGIVPAVISLALMIGNIGGDNFDPAAGHQIDVFGRNLNADVVLTFFSVVITIVDGSVLIADQQKRALHDKLAGTFVVLK